MVSIHTLIDFISSGLDKFIEEYIINKNTEVEKFNAKADIEARMFVDLFS
jgi:hypothetical protein